MRFRLPEDCAGVIHAGVALDRATDGTIEADESAAFDLAPHGLVPVAADGPAAKPVPARSRADDRRMLR